MRHATYIRLYADEHGESHFEDVELSLAPVDFAPPAPPLHLAPFLPTGQSLWVGAPPGWAGETPHPAPRRQIFCTLPGEYEITASDGAFLPAACCCWKIRGEKATLAVSPAPRGFSSLPWCWQMLHRVDEVSTWFTSSTLSQPGGIHTR